MKSLAAQGHEVVLIGHPQSSCTAHSIRLIPEDQGGDWRKRIPKDTQLLHLFYTPNLPQASLPSHAFEHAQNKDVNVPTIVTIEGNGKPGEYFHPNTVFVSKKHAQNHASSVYVHNGLDFSEYPFNYSSIANSWTQFLFLAKASWKVKNLKDCVRGCVAAGKYLHVAGGRAWHLSSKIHSHGMVDQTQKLRLLEACDALLFPVRWEEPFGIAIIEAFALGLPVIGSSYGSLPELINSDCGILCENYSEFLNALKNPKKRFDPLKIRRYAEQNFSIEKMTQNYMKLYKRVLQGEQLNSSIPHTVSKNRADQLLNF